MVNKTYIKANETNMIQTVFLAFDGALNSSFALPLEMLQAANEHNRVKRRPTLSTQTVTPKGQMITFQNGLTLDGPAIDSIERPGFVYIPSFWRSPHAMLEQLAHLYPLFAKWHHQGTRFCGVSTGTYVLAEAGLLDYEAGTTHWAYFEDFAKRYPQVKLQREYFITVSNEVYCAGSVNSLADLTVHLIADAMDDAAANWVQRNFSHEIRRNFHDVAYIKGRSGHSDEDIAVGQQWIKDNLQHPDILTEITNELDMSPRTFSRRFRAASGMTPKQYVQQCRIDQAQQLLRHSNLAIGEVSFNVGYQDVSFFAQLFRRQLGLTPSEYRRTVRAKLFINP